MAHVSDKTCTGPSHSEPVLLPLTSRYWHFRQSGPLVGRPLAHCRQCQNWARLLVKDVPHGVTPAEPLRVYAVELLERCGSYDRVRALYGINDTTLGPIVRGLSANVRRLTAQRILSALDLQRKEDRRSGQTSRRYLVRLRSRGMRTEYIERGQGLT